MYVWNYVCMDGYDVITGDVNLVNNDDLKSLNMKGSKFR